MEAKDTAKAERLSILESMMDIKTKYLSNRTQQGQERAKICDEIIGQLFTREEILSVDDIQDAAKVLGEYMPLMECVHMLAKSIGFCVRLRIVGSGDYSYWSCGFGNTGIAVKNPDPKVAVAQCAWNLISMATENFEKSRELKNLLMSAYGNAPDVQSTEWKFGAYGKYDTWTRRVRKDGHIIRLTIDTSNPYGRWFSTVWKSGKDTHPLRVHTVSSRTQTAEALRNAVMNVIGPDGIWSDLGIQMDGAPESPEPNAAVQSEDATVQKDRHQTFRWETVPKSGDIASSAFVLRAGKFLVELKYVFAGPYSHHQGWVCKLMCNDAIIASGYHSSRPTLATTDVLLFLKACVEPFGGKFEVANGEMISEIDIKVPLTT